MSINLKLSDADGWISCPRKPEREKVARSLLPEQETNSSALRGTYLHKLAEAVMKGDESMPVAPPGAEVSAADEESAMSYAGYVINKSLEQIPSQFHTEVEVNLGAAVGLPEGYTSRGVVDCEIVTPKTLEVIEYKSGGGLVETSSQQLWANGLASLLRYTNPGVGESPFEEIILTVYQPKRPGTKNIERSIVVQPQSLLSWEQTVLQPAYAEVMDEAVPAKPSNSACKYRLAKKAGICEEYKAFVSAGVGS